MSRADAENSKAFFAAFPDAFRLFKALKKHIGRYGHPRLTVSRSQLSFGEKYKYAWVWLPQKWIRKRPPESITLTLLTGKKLKHKRITESVQARKAFWTHHIVIGSTAEIDEDLAALIKAAWQLQLERKQSKKTPHAKKRR